MTALLNLFEKFDLNINRLANLSEESYALYEDLQNSLNVMRKKGIPSIGNPILRLENKVLTLVYRTMQHQINCELYASLVEENSLDTGLEIQLNSLYEMTNILTNRYSQYLIEWKNIEIQQEERIIEINKLSIPA
jgi:hypothetical protein